MTEVGQAQANNLGESVCPNIHVARDLGQNLEESGAAGR